jgi:hypothetical protein
MEAPVAPARCTMRLCADMLSLVQSLINQKLSVLTHQLEAVAIPWRIFDLLGRSTSALHLIASYPYVSYLATFTAGFGRASAEYGGVQHHDRIHDAATLRI